MNSITTAVSNEISWTYTSLFHQCDHVEVSLSSAIAYCSCVSVLFVGSLYVVVPSRIRRLQRENPLQIRWRAIAIAGVSVVVLVAYPFIFCKGGSDGKGAAVLARMGWFTPMSMQSILGPLFHAMLLYLGCLVAMILRIQGHRDSRYKYVDLLCVELVGSTPTHLLHHESDRWICIRNLVIAPVMEELIFRGCLLPPLLAATGVTFAIWISPLFFGFAHLHHGILLARQGYPLARILIMVVFQFTYTSLFGIYCAYALFRTGSLVAIILCHSFCNSMGLPNILDDLINSRSSLYKYRVLLVAAHILGILAHIGAYRSNLILPLPAQLPYTPPFLET